MKGVFIVGAGPAGLFAARQIALAGYEVFLFNRDIKPGGLAEYGIYPLKDKMKTGLRKQFSRILELFNIHYFGHVQIGSGYDLTIEDLQAMHPAAILFACGAQGYKKLGLPGEDAKGVYSAKDFVYHYNQLPPYASIDYPTGKRVAIIGVGNVAIDIARWLLEDDPAKQTEEVIILARRGPLEIKFDEKEIEHVEHHISREELLREFERIKERCARSNQDVSAEKIFEHHFRRLKDPALLSVSPKLSFRFLSSPTAILPDEDGRIARLLVTENDLVLKEDGSTSARTTGESTTLDIDTLIFAIGDRHDSKIGLPMGADGFATRPAGEPYTGHPAEPSFEIWNPENNSVIPGQFVVGWARQASTGLVGVARHDGEIGAHKVIEYVRKSRDPFTLTEQQIQAQLEAKGIHVATKLDAELLAHAEAHEALVRHLPYFRFTDDEAMFTAIEQEREQLVSSPASYRNLARTG